MKTLFFTMLLSTALVFGCGKKDEEGGEGGGGGDSVDVPAEMKAFMGMIDGKAASVEAALAKHGAEGLDSKDMDMYDLKEAKVVAGDDKGCYTMEAKAGMTVRTYVLCWKDGKIASVEDKGMR